MTTVSGRATALTAVTWSRYYPVTAVTWSRYYPVIAVTWSIETTMRVACLKMPVHP